ncbi:hypothetical protein GE061_005146 [Apolygus lucorum]|uniref:DUF4773 domain-containing protein n=1 Tax=Apolygus lucorum TaxID=248454 RepID=A0A6A4IYL8_APOLU|nr:hypothetical protein GE061_005146 [Apolygus lucorum]
MIPLRRAKMNSTFVFCIFLGLFSSIVAQYDANIESNDVVEIDNFARYIYGFTPNNHGCSCKQLRCECCGGVHALGKRLKLCADLEADFPDKAIDVDIKVAGKHLVHQKISMHNGANICKRAPFPLNSIKFCFGADVNLPEHSGVHICPKFEVFKGHAHIHSLKKVSFPCVEIHRPHIFVEEVEEPAQDQENEDFIFY